MALHKTQCPHCFTSYVISDAQLRVSEGMVRCGTCRERFQARLIDDVETPRFDPREVFIEPLSDEVDESVIASINEIEEHLTPQDIKFADPHTEPEGEHERLSINPSTSIDLDPDLIVSSDIMADDLPVSRSDDLDAGEMLANIEAKQERNNELAEQHELILPDIDEVSSPLTQDAATEEHKQHTETDESNGLIDQVSALVDDKLLNSPVDDTSESGNATADEAAILKNSRSKELSLDRPSDDQVPFDLAPKVRRKGMAWLYVPLLFVVIVALCGLLSYQLWMKQLVHFDEGSLAHTKFIELTTPLARELEKHDIELPLRRNLSQMELLSARTEPHPTRSSTTLLRVSIVNRADISQPLPWLEMSLTDADGRLVSRRNLSPADYLYNNNSLNQIGAKELKRVTIELLSFPKQATGYELKLLNR